MPRDVSPVAQSLHAVLRPLGFKKNRARWNRDSGPFVDVIDIQKGQVTRDFTVNCGVFLPLAYTLVWGKAPAKFISEVDCTVRSRIGALIDDHDLWWDIKEETIPQEVIEDIVSKVEAYVLPFLDRMHSSEAMEAYLIENQVIRYPIYPEVLFLAILMWQNGKKDEAFGLLSDHVNRDIGWTEFAREVMEKLKQK